MELLRATHAPIDWQYMPHSALALQLRMGVIETEYDMKYKLAYMQGYASLHAHPQSDIQKAFAEFANIYRDARSALPFMTGGKGAAEQLKDEYMQLAREFEAMMGPNVEKTESKEPSLKVVSAKGD